ncbi:aminodeoxychorismate lyase [Peribacillus tepidiphilus]|uniref:aminodeoxychorismate lyase n=1 Tax=Peribacillus tepidiphilus TaxID=2652445 RepID=UPI001291C59F|nr:aminodeoxychorismate lyase [Peribacillus tepidiphilus]
MFLYLNGTIVKEEEAVISPFDHGFLYGLGVFETFRVYNGHCFLLGDHINRLNLALKEMDIQYSVSMEQVKEIVQALLLKNKTQNARIRLNVSAGKAPLGLQGEAYEEPNVIVFMNPLSKAGSELAEKEAILLKTPRNTPETAFRLKSHHYLNNIAGKKEMKNEPNAEGLFLTREGYMAEGLVSNIFWIKNEVLYTPDVNTGILNGITRQFVMKLAKNLKIVVVEGFFKPEELYDAEEVFLTNSIQEIVAISRVKNIASFAGAKGIITNKLFQEYQKVRERL